MCRAKMSVAFALVAALSLNSAERAWAAPITVQSYAYNGAYFVPSGSYPDNGAAPGTGLPNTELIDGLYPTIGVGTTYTDPRWVGVQSPLNDSVPQPEITFNLGSVYDLNSATIIYDVHNGVGIHAPDSVSVSFSDDDVIYSTPVSLTGFDNTGSVITRSTTFLFPTNSSGQYARLSFYNDQDWTFLAEVSFESVEPAPEPSSLLLLGLGTCLLSVKRKSTSQRAAQQFA